MSDKILIIGLDGVGFDLTTQFMHDGVMPNLAKLCQEGAYAQMLSPAPLQSTSTWTSFITGKNPGKHGIFGFFTYKNNSYESKVSNSLERKSETLWHILNRYGKTVGILNLPSLFPPEKIDGYMICGMLAPSISCQFTYPRELKEKLLKRVIGYEIDIGMAMSSKDAQEVVLKKTYQITEKRAEAAKFLLREFPCDVNIVIFTETDHILHVFQKDMGTQSKYKDVIRDYFHFLDSKIGQIINENGKDSPVIVISDHGMKVFRKVFYVNNLLRRMGLFNEEEKSVRKPTYTFVYFCFQFIIDLMVKMRLSPDTLKRFLPFWLFKRLNIILGEGKGHDWSKTKAFATSIGDGIIINLKGRQPNGIVPIAEYERMKDAIIEEIKKIRDPDTNEGIVYSINKREEAFFGEFVNEAPDIILRVKEGYSTDRSTKIAGVLEKESFLEPVHSDHTCEAMLIMHGENIKRGAIINKPAIFDITPTILGLSGIPIPSGLDGRVLSEAISEKRLESSSDVISERLRLHNRIKELKSSGKIK